MKQYLSFLLLFCFFIQANAQSTGDTIVVNTFQYGSTTRDTVIPFPNTPGLTFEKVIMLYNMRCKNGLVSPGTPGQTNIGCGEWDYSCNTYITDSSRVDSMLSGKSSHTISNFAGSMYPYTTTPFYNLYQYTLSNTTASIISENQYAVGSGIISLPDVIAANQKSGRSQYLFTQAELLAAGVTLGNISGILLEALNASTANFLKIRIKHTNLNALNAASPELSGFTETYYANTNFLTGLNRLQFHTPFNWDGVSNVIIDFSFTNSTPGIALDILGENTGSNYGLYTSNGAFINTAGGVVSTLPAAPFSSINTEITVAFWSRGNSGISSVNTSIIEGIDNGNNRQLNIHHPWSNANIYFDCGNIGAGYDRINKVATPAEVENVWNYWAFTKNTTSGIMNIYLNGTLWHTGTGKTIPINIDSVMLGANINGGNLYLGDIDDLSIWNAELPASEISAWMNKTIDASHPYYGSLVAYYTLNEGNGTVTNDQSVNAQISNYAFTPDWKYSRGDQLFKSFTSTTNRPNTIFLQGTYSLTNTNVIALDSIQAAANIVKEYSVTSNAGTMQSDILNLVNTNAYWLASYRYLYDGITHALIDSFPLVASNTINITSLPFTDRYPAKYEIMSFVTPYGINLDMGINGKTWTFDMTDYLPILKGNKRMSIERGGQWQENMDIKFLFIVGTPPRDVLDNTQLWRQPNNCNYNDIVTDKYFEPRDVKMNVNASSYKVRTMITGHGQEGEFIPRIHSLNINGGSNEFEWEVYKKCASNPLYPQGGTWIYDRTGWCPGMASDLEEADITQFVTPGQIANLDYHMLPATGIGTSNYIVTNQLVSYGAMNHTLDASVIDIMSPTTKFEYAREQAICNHPKIVIQNTGSTLLTSLLIEYWINNNTSQKSSFTWTGSLSAMQKTEVELPANALWVNVNGADNEFHVEVKNPNGGTDEYAYNNKMTSSFKITDVVPSNFIIYHRSNSAASETKYELFDLSGNLIFSRNGMSNLTTYRDTFNLPQGCYKFVMTDTDEDGISFWANSDGAGVIRFQRGNGTNFKTFNPDFGASIVYNFTIDYPLSYEELYESNEVKIYPNPATNQFTIEGNEIDKMKFQFTNVVGQTIHIPSQKVNGKIICNTSSLSKGIYFVNLNYAGKNNSYKVVIE
ncbi:MAG: T9SS type A sorting domain-containing protein [Bacteroidetes bacterium]|nr:T9SS type A sorting domain-containing protein [Bacteroidota bacterium]